jgi:HD superfamily phosphodiesterase
MAYKIVSMKEIFKQIWQMAGPYLDTRDNDIHTRISIKFAYKLLELEGGDEDVVIPAITLHDVGWKKVPEDLQLKAFGPKATLPELVMMHEDEGVKVAKDILSRVDYDGTKVKEVLQIIESHDSVVESVSLNGDLVRDADKLFRYSRECLDIYTEKFDVTYDEMLNMLGAKLQEWFLTESGREMAKQELKKRSREMEESRH